MIRAVLFDAVGTLIELREPAGVFYSRVAKRHGVGVPASHLTDAFVRVLASASPMDFSQSTLEEIPALERRWWWERVRETWRAADGTARFEDFDAYFDELFQLFATEEAWQLIDGALELLETLTRRGVPLVVVSNFDHRLPALLTRLGVDGFFQNVFIPSKVGCGKPDARIFQAALASVEGNPAEILFVGDHPELDLGPAKNLGMPFLAVDPAVDLKKIAAEILDLLD